MSFKITTHGDLLSGQSLDRLDLADELEEQWRPEAKLVAAEAADIMLDEVRKVLNRRQGTAQTAAPPGEPPERDTGALAGSFKRIPPRVRGRVASSGVQSDDPAANRLEFGKTDVRGIRTLPHPFMRPALAAAEPKVTALVQKRLGS